MSVSTGDLPATSVDALAAAIDLLSQHDRLMTAMAALDAKQPVTWEGVFPGALPPWCAAHIKHFDKPILIVCAHAPDAESLAEDLAELVSRPVLMLPQSSEDSSVETLLEHETILRLQVIGRLRQALFETPPPPQMPAQILPKQPPLRKLLKSKSEPPPPVEVAQIITEPAKYPPPIVVTTMTAIMAPLPSPTAMQKDRRKIAVGGKLDVDELRRWLIESGYHATSAVQLPGEFAVRGGIMDLYAPDATGPVRIELFDDEIESLRLFDAATQRSIEKISSLDLAPTQATTENSGSLLDYFPDDSPVILFEPKAIVYTAEAFIKRVPFPQRFASPTTLLSRISQHPLIQMVQLADGYDGTLLHAPLGDVQRIGGSLETIAEDIDKACNGRPVHVLAINDGEYERLNELLGPCRLKQTGFLQVAMGRLSAGFEILPDGPMILVGGQLFRRAQMRRPTRKIQSRAIDSFLDLREGDLIVHLSHGIGIYRGLSTLDKHGQTLEHLELEFDGGTKIYVPAAKIDLVQRYVGGTKSKPRLAKIGGQSWVKQKKAAQEAVTDMAADLIELQARRASQPGVAFSADSAWQHQFDASFPYTETEDQLQAIEAVKRDLTTARPMDRLICGDVGFGKTEVAMRAAFKAVDSGYQVAVLVPTTVLAEQHYQSFRERMSEFPFDIAKLSRFSTKGEQKETLDLLASGKIDIVIGTHRLASKDVKFYNLGLFIIDEEQRFGVEIKERIKRHRPNVDVLTLSATPIPRTLHMSLLGVRDISNLETPPEDRLSVETKVIRFDEAIIRNAIIRELNREGQVYFVHNRISDIEILATKIKRIAPEARVIIGHGQMREHQLERVMVDFIEHRYDVLLSTTIIESGLDIPNANTIFIDEADRYGLSELHQLRGRVGRYKNQAHCYLLVDRHKMLTPDAARRLHAIEEYSHIGAGFGIAMRDLEIRGAGNLLGTQQSGHIAAVGYELYCQLLEGAVRTLQHQAPQISLDVDIDLPIDAYMPADYVPSMRDKIDLYRRMSRIDKFDQLTEIRQELSDRFGAIPKPVNNLLSLAELRLDAAGWLIRAISVEETYLVLTYSDRGRIEQLGRKHPGRVRIVDQHKAYVPMDTKKGGPINWLAAAQSILRL